MVEEFFKLQLVENRLLLNINLGGRSETSMALGSLLDDNTFHEVFISRERRDVILSVDRVRIRDRVQVRSSQGIPTEREDCSEYS